jgi:hypothetical protein
MLHVGYDACLASCRQNQQGQGEPYRLLGVRQATVYAPELLETPKPWCVCWLQHASPFWNCSQQPYRARAASGIRCQQAARSSAPDSLSLAQQAAAALVGIDLLVSLQQLCLEQLLEYALYEL